MFSCTVNNQIELRQIGLHHTQELFALIDANRIHLRRGHPWLDLVRSAGDVEKVISTWQLQSANNQGICASIWRDEQFCGLIHHVNLDVLNRTAALSYWLAAKFQGQGIMTESCRAFIAHSFDTLKLNRITIQCGANNFRSRAIPERLGFTLEGILRGVEWQQDHFENHAIYGLLAKDFHLCNPPFVDEEPKSTLHELQFQ